MIKKYFRYIFNTLFFPIRHRASLNKMKQVRDEKSLFFNTNKRINVVFLIQYIESWNKMSKLYSLMKNNDIFCPAIVCVPSDYSKFNKLNHLNNDIYNYFIQNGYEAYNAVGNDNKWLDLEQFRPTYVFQSRPYNNYMPFEYSSDVLKSKYLIANILYGESCSLNIANIVINKDYYKDVFCFFPFDESEKKLYKNKFSIGPKNSIQKCDVLGKTGLEFVLDNRMPKKDVRRSVVWTPRWSTDKNVGGSNFLEYKDTLFGLASKYKDIDFVFRPHPLTFSNFIKKGIMTEKEVNDFRNKCKESENIILDERKEYIDTFWSSDLLISDFSSVVLEYFVTGKPIIYCLSNVNMVYSDIGNKIMSTLYSVKNEKELVNQFIEWYKGNDKNKDARESVIKNLDVDNSSDRILNKLIEYLR